MSEIWFHLTVTLAIDCDEPLVLNRANKWYLFNHWPNVGGHLPTLLKLFYLAAHNGCQNCRYKRKSASDKTIFKKLKCSPYTSSPKPLSQLIKKQCPWVFKLQCVPKMEIGLIFVRSRFLLCACIAFGKLGHSFYQSKTSLYHFPLE